MKSIAIIFLQFIFIVSLAQHQDQVKRISYQCNDLSFEDFSRSVYEKSGTRIFYLDSLVLTIKVTLSCSDITVDSLVRLALQGSGLNVNVWNNDLVILPTEATLLKALPDFTNKTVSGKIADTVKRPVESEERYMKGRRADVSQTIRIGKAGVSDKKSAVTILGRITDAQTGEPVIGATMYLEELKDGSVSDHNGFINMTVKPGKYTARFEFLGYEKEKYQLEISSGGEFSIEMNQVMIEMREVVVFGDRQMNIRQKDPGLEKISMKTIKEIPMMMGERDILKVSEMLPGIVTVGEGSAGLNVRGGNSDQNAFFISKIPVYNTSHLFGFMSAFDADVIKDVSIYKGQIPAQYGGRLSSVFNILTRHGNRRQFTAHGSLSPFAVNLSVEGPIKKDTCSFILSGRYLYSDWILGQIDDPVIRNSKAGFNDFTASVNYDKRESQMSVFIYHSGDNFKLSNLNEYQYFNNGASLNFGHNFNTSLRGDLAFIVSNYKFSTIDQQEVSTAYDHSYAIEHYELRTDFSHVINEKNTLTYGLDVILYRLNRGLVSPYGAESLRMPVDLGKEQGFEGSLYIADQWEPLPWIDLTLGLRYTLFSPTGPKTVYTYAPGMPTDIRYVTDTLQYGSAEPIKYYNEPEIRAGINIETDPNGSVKMAFNQMHQNLFMLSNTIAISPNTQWKLADYHIEPSSSSQYSLGVFRLLPWGGWETSLEGFYKSTKNYPEFKDGADFLSTPLVETTVLQGDQRAYGVELLLKRSNRRLEGWIAYTYSRSLVKIDGGEDWEKINNGKEYPANYDIPNAFNAVVNYHINRRITLSTVVTYQTGRPITYPTSVYYINGIPYVDYSERNAYRIPDYFRMDASLTLEGNLKKNKLIHSSLIFSLYNLTGRDNPYSVYFTTENGKIRSYQYSVIGVPIFTVTWMFKLGNYASE